jgi:hypothetical protein
MEKEKEKGDEEEEAQCFPPPQLCERRLSKWKVREKAELLLLGEHVYFDSNKCIFLYKHEIPYFTMV